MEILVALFYLLSGFAILILGGEFLVKSAVSIAARLDVSPAVIGLTIIAAGTSAPELMTSILASLKGTNDIAVGNVVGSNIFNILAILGFAGLLKTNIVEKNMMKFDVPALILFSIIFLGFSYDNIIHRWEGILLLLAYIAFAYVAFKRSRLDELADEEIAILKNWPTDLTYLTLGLVALVGGAHISLIGGESLGRIFGLSERVIGITIISIGTGLPELATSAVAAYRGQNQIAVANVIGSNIINTLVVIGATSSILPLSVNPEILNFDMIWMFAVTVAIIPIFILNKYKIDKKLSFLLLSIYTVYLILITTH